MLIKICFIVFFLVILFVVKAYKDKNLDQIKLEKRLEREWSKSTREEYSDKIWKYISSFFVHHKSKQSIDDITWNDLNMDDIYKKMNHTRTSAGEALLYHVLRTPVFDEKELFCREKIISAFSDNRKERENMEKAFMAIGKSDVFSIYDYLLEVRGLKPYSKIPHLLCSFLLVIGIVLIFFLPPVYLFFFFAIVLFNIFYYFDAKNKHIKDITLFHFIFRLLRGCEEITTVTFPEIHEEIKRIHNYSKKFEKYKRFHFLVASGNNMSGTIFDSLLDYIRILFHVDLIKISTMIHEVQAYEKELLLIFEEVGMLDAMLSVASFRASLPFFSLPVFQYTSEDNAINVQEIYHPLLEHAVTNSFDMKKSILLTGSNASGKSTFLKTTAVNIIFAQSIHTVLSKSYQSPFYKVYSSMALRDDIIAKESYFVVEIRSLKRLFDAKADSCFPVFCFVDEILRGTNTVERVAASSALLSRLSEEHIICMAATHDIELTYLLEQEYDNYHFEEQVSNGDISFDYLLKRGRTKSSNAILLMEQSGFDKNMIETAKKRAHVFLKEGIWE